MKIRTIITLVVVAIVLTVVSLWMGQQSYSWFPPQASVEAKLIDYLFSFLVTIGTFIFLGVVGTLTYSVLTQQAAKYDYSDGPAIEGNNTLEIVWTAIPILLVIWIAAYSYQIYTQMSIQGPMEHFHLSSVGGEQTPSLFGGEQNNTIEVHSRQWAWEFHYPEQNLISTELHLPSNQRALLKLESDDVIHGFFIPAFRVKQDIIPGKITNFEFTPTKIGKYRLRDSQYSGTYFAAMQTDVVVESPEDYQKWLTSAAKQAPFTAYNRAFVEYNKSSSRIGWKTIKPAAPPLVNYSQESDL